MSKRYRLFRRNGIYYIHDGQIGKQVSLRTKKKEEAQRVISAHQEATVQPSINLLIARAYLHASDPAYLTRTLGDALNDIINQKHNSTFRWMGVVAEWEKPRVQTNSPVAQY